MIINHLALLSLCKISKIEKELSPRAGWKRGWKGGGGAILSALQSTYNNDSALGSRRGLVYLYMNIYVHIHHSYAFPRFAFFFRFLINKNRKILKFFPTFQKLLYCQFSVRNPTESYSSKGIGHEMNNLLKVYIMNLLLSAYG
jgi:hypothetical protein